MKTDSLIDATIQSNIEWLKDHEPGSSGYAKAAAIVDDYRHKQLLTMHNESMEVQRNSNSLQTVNNGYQKWVLICTVALLVFTLALLVLTFALFFAEHT